MKSATRIMKSGSQPCSFCSRVNPGRGSAGWGPPGTVSGWPPVVPAAPPATHALSPEATDWPSRTQRDTTCDFCSGAPRPPWITFWPGPPLGSSRPLPSPIHVPHLDFSRDLRHGTRLRPCSPGVPPETNPKPLLGETHCCPLVPF